MRSRLNSLIQIFAKFESKYVLTIFFICHLLVAAFLGRLFAFAPDEASYIFTFNKIYSNETSLNGKVMSGWNGSPTVFLWFIFLPAKILNLLGAPDYISLRFLSSLLVTLTIYILILVSRRINSLKGFELRILILFFCIPSVFIWTSLGIRESYILFALALIFSGFNYFIEDSKRFGLTLLFIGSLFLISTKFYLWILLCISIVLTCFFMRSLRKQAQILSAFILVPYILFLSTTPASTHINLLKINIFDLGVRSGASTYSTNVLSPASPSAGDTMNFNGNYTLIALHEHYIAAPASLFTSVSRQLGIVSRVNEAWESQLQGGKQLEEDSTSQGTNIQESGELSPAKISDPGSFFIPVGKFLFGPIPFQSNLSFGAKIASFESPLWWIAYMLLSLRLYSCRRGGILRKPQVIFPLLTLVVFTFLSAIIEVNLGTSFRHRSIIILPIAFLCVVLRNQRSNKSELV